MKETIKITYTWWIDKDRSPPKGDHREVLREAALATILPRMREGYVSGEMTDNVRLTDADGEDGIAYRGWFEVARSCQTH